MTECTRRSGRHSKLFLISDLYRVDTENAEVHADIARRFSKSIIPLNTFNELFQCRDIIYLKKKNSLLHTRSICLIYTFPADHDPYAHRLDPDETPNDFTSH